MPVPFREIPEFNPYGRYAINVRERKEPGSVTFHDLENIVAGCGIAEVPVGSLSRFNNPKWAVQRGHVPCALCIQSGE